MVSIYYESTVDHRQPSCVNVSNLTTTPGSVLSDDCESGRGYLGMEKYVKKRRPKMVLLENVAALFHKRRVEGGQSAYLNLTWFELFSTLCCILDNFWIEKHEEIL